MSTASHSSFAPNVRLKYGIVNLKFGAPIAGSARNEGGGGGIGRAKLGQRTVTGLRLSSTTRIGWIDLDDNCGSAVEKCGQER